ncbi:MAG: aminotransferase DegT [bacterium]|nr:aminotransferase DegT [bacterium]
MGTSVGSRVILRHLKTESKREQLAKRSLKRKCIGRSIPPTAAVINPRDILSGIRAVVGRERELDRFVEELKEYFGAKHCFLLSSGKAALTIILEGLKEIHPDRDEVLIPAFTCPTVPAAIVRAGLQVRLCDIDPEKLDFDFEHLSMMLSGQSKEKAAEVRRQIVAKSPRNPLDADGNGRNPAGAIGYDEMATKCGVGSSLGLNEEDGVGGANNGKQIATDRDRLLCIIPTDLFGLPADVEKIRGISDDPEILIIEDAAQAMGAEWKGSKMGTRGDVGFFSLGRGKAFSTVEGGIILTNSDVIAHNIQERMKEVRVYGIAEIGLVLVYSIALAALLHPRVFWIPKALPFIKLGETIYDTNFSVKKMSSFQAGLARNWKMKLSEFRRSRGENAMRLFSVLGSGLLDCFASEQHRLPDLLRFPLMIEQTELREEILRMSCQKGLGIMESYKEAVCDIRELRNEFSDADFPVAREFASRLITLPIHPLLSRKDMRRIVEAVALADSKGNECEHLSV